MQFNKWDVWWAFVPLEENKNELLKLQNAQNKI